jgi:MerR family transcriptional regulator, thiopeptide resistance regulator
MKVGELARRTGLSVRTLHYYDEIGLLEPSTHTKSQHRLYGQAELERLQRIKSLRHLGFSLEEIRACLDKPEFSLRAVIDLHTTRLRAQIKEQTRLALLLETLAASLDTASSASVDDLISVIESTTTLDREFTPEEHREIRERGKRLGSSHITAVEAEWPALIARVRVEMLRGTEPTDACVLTLARRWRELVREFTGGNPSIERKVRAAFIAEPERMAGAGLGTAIFAYINRAIRAL